MGFLAMSEEMEHSKRFFIYVDPQTLVYSINKSTNTGIDAQAGGPALGAEGSPQLQPGSEHDNQVKFLETQSLNNCKINYDFLHRFK